MINETSAGGASRLERFKSSYSSSEGDSCVEVAAAPGAVHVRDSKDLSVPQLVFAPGAWAGFVAHTAAD